MASSNARIDKHTYLVSTSILLGACVLSVTLRFYIRIWVQRQFSVDDAFLILAVCCLISAVAVMYAVTLDKMYRIQALSAALPIALSFGFDVKAISGDGVFLQQAYEYLKWITVNQTLAWSSVFAVKFSFLFLFRRLIERLPRLIIYWWLVVAFNVVAFGYGLLTYFLICPHYNDPKIYECSLPSGFQRLIRHGIAQTAMDIMGDLLILYIPINLIWKIQLKWRQKVPLVLSLCLTGVMILVTITRVAGIEVDGQIDSVWESYFLIVAAEVGILLASVSTYRAFFVSQRRGGINKTRKTISDPGHWYSSKKKLNRVNKTQIHISYDYRAQIWRCCGNTADGVSDCDHPTAESFSAPAPTDLSTIYSSVVATETKKESLSTSTASFSMPFYDSTTVKWVSKTAIKSSLSSPPTMTPATPAAGEETSGPSSDGKTHLNDGEGGLTPGDKIALVIGIPGTLATIAAAYYTYATFRHKRRQSKKRIVISSRKPSVARMGQRC
ncbi:MAG: hypothetical protein Q9186_000182 [Xanthomendoza sp. 1 TL-2023]